jgi:hypothetical protein
VYKDIGNKSAEIAKVFVKELDEKFYIVLAGDTPRQKKLCKFTNDGLRVWDDVNGWYWDSENVLYEMITGQAAYYEEESDN